MQWRRDPACTIDVVEFDAALARAADAAKRGDADGERAALEEAARLYQDDLLRGLYDDWLQPKREHYRRQLGHVLQPPGDRCSKPAATIPPPSVTPNGWWHWIRWPRRTTRC